MSLWQRGMCQASSPEKGPAMASACSVARGKLVIHTWFSNMLILWCVSQACPNLGDGSLLHSLFKIHPWSVFEDDFATLTYSVCIILPGYFWGKNHLAYLIVFVPLTFCPLIFKWEPQIKTKFISHSPEHWLLLLSMQPLQLKANTLLPLAKALAPQLSLERLTVLCKNSPPKLFRNPTAQWD